ncbi:MAG: hypothetical protein QW165_03705 [Candidatus Woesearchaeota archaeon]
MNKKGLELTTGTIVAIVLGLIILVILVIFAQQQVAKGGKQFGEIQKEAEYGPDKCQSIIKGTFCASTCDPAKYTTQSTAPTGQPWTDCKSKNLQVCCVPKEA